MQTPSSTSGQSAGADTGIASAAGSAASVSNLFTTLLVAQIRNQNPLEPTDPSEFVGQLAQLSQMEALQKLTDQGAASTSILSSLQLLSLGAQVGSQITVRSDTMTLAGEPVQIGFTLENLSAQNTLVLTASDGSTQRIELGTLNPGAAHYTIDPAKLGLPAGTYSMEIVADNKETPPLDITGTLSSVQLSSSGMPLLNVTGAGQVQPGLITGFNGQPSTHSH
ncbi:flagellar hook capping FlgD N-terminal domain-containing protein [Stenotrophomonas sp. YIM B06876]|uniref:flagellar hook capping FlgD N-terminal domain-containing protein n=1 Tax=Stenotrophomonas sp. YIM B06876 TaxID=3060211 RepID=UPI00273828CA|nr:flagellar hook capping FlgD N-terminal domain-containing protein [Stenotrophomonas sp. YIM B06876]